MTKEQKEQYTAVTFMMKELIAGGFEFSEWEEGFLSDQEERLKEYGEATRISPKQFAAIQKIYDKYVTN